jgi:hypothetical protein
VRNRRTRNKFLRRVRRDLEAKRHRQEQEALAPCPRCGRRAGQVALIGFRSGGPGCEHCASGLPGEDRSDGRVHVVRITNAPTREEIRAAREAEEAGSASATPKPLDYFGLAKLREKETDPRPSYLVAYDRDDEEENEG